MWYAVCDRDPGMSHEDNDLGSLISQLNEEYPDLHWLSVTDDGKIILHGMAARIDETAPSDAISENQE